MSIGDKRTFWELISGPNIESIEIPQIQRDYVQGRKTQQVKYSRERLLSEIKDALTTGKPLDLNFVYGKDDHKVFVPIDGQQRLTTLLTLHIYAFAKEKKTDELNILKSKFRYLTRTSTQRFLEELINNLSEYFEQAELNIESFIKDSAWYSTEWDKDPSVNSFIVVLSGVDERFKKICNLSEKLMGSNCPVSFMALKITDVGQINDLYIKMNSRGKALTELETFKSELFDYLDAGVAGVNISDFKKKADNEWLSMIWDLCETPQTECDSVYMSFIHRIIMNRLIAGRYNVAASKDWDNLNNNNGFYNFDDYKPYLSDGKALQDVYKTFELCLWLINNGLGKKISRRIYESGKLNYMDQVQIAALTKYAVDVPVSSWTPESWNAWNRVTTNLINNTEIDRTDRFISAASSIYSMDVHAPADTYNYFSGIPASKIDFFKDQAEEEILKCSLINLDKDWLNIFINAEANSYFEGKIQFALTLSGITSADPAFNQKNKQADFRETWRIIDLLFDPEAPTKLGVNDSLFRRGLLTYGDYSIWANSTHTLFFEGGKGYFNWRRMLRESLSVFAKLFNDLKAQKVSTSAEVNSFLENAIDSYTNKADELIYYMIKIPEVLDFMREKRFRRSAEDATNKRNILYSGARLSTDYAEAFSFFAYCLLPGTDKKYHYGRGYLESETTFAYIEKVKGKDTHIEYDYSQNCFCDEDHKALIDKNGNYLKTTDELIASLCERMIPDPCRQPVSG